jgi:hypothetical protein
VGDGVGVVVDITAVEFKGSDVNITAVGLKE